MLYGALCFWVLLQQTGSSLVKHASGTDSFKQCLISTPTSFGYCLGMGALSKLQSIDNDPEFNLVDGVTFAMDEQQVRESYNFMDRDPGDFRTIVDSVGQVFSRRSLKWDMSMLYPGLAMRVAPSANPGGILEFVLDPHRESLSHHSLKEASTVSITQNGGECMNFRVQGLAAQHLSAGLAPVAPEGRKAYQVQGMAVGANKYGDEQYLDEYLFRESGAYPDENTANSVRGFNEVQQPYARDEARGRNFAWNEAEKKAKT